MVVWPGLVIEITPPQTQVNFDVALREGVLAISTVGEPGIQGAGVTGTHGIGVNVPKAAAVAAATCGFARD